MSARLRDLKVTKVDFVDNGDNKRAHVILFKRAQTSANMEESEKREGAVTEMKIDKSKMTDEERVTLEDFEKRYGVEEAEPAAEPQGSGGADPESAGVVKSAGAAQETKQTPAEDDEDIYKGLNPAVQRELEELKKFKQDAEDAALREVAGEYEILGKRADELFPVLKSLKAKDAAAYEQMIAALDGAKNAVEKSDARFLEHEPHLLLKGQVLVHKHAYSHRKRLCADITCHIKYQRLECHDERQLSDYLFKCTYDRGYDYAEPEEYQQPRHTLFHALGQRFVEVLLCGETGKTGVILAHFVVYYFYDALRCDVSQKLV